jgi:hypothetical protein
MRCMKLRANLNYPKYLLVVTLPFLIFGCDSTMHKIANVGGVDTLSTDAKQRLVFVGMRADDHGGSKRVTCGEPSPDAW